MTEEYQWLQSCFSYISSTEYPETDTKSTVKEIEWLKSFLTMDPISIERQDKPRIHKRYQAILAFLRFTMEKYVELYRIQYGERIDERTILRNKQYDSSEKMIILLYHPEFVFDKFVYHRNSSLLTEEELDQALEIFDLYEQFYYSIINHLDVMMARPSPQFSDSFDINGGFPKEEPDLGE